MEEIRWLFCARQIPGMGRNAESVRLGSVMAFSEEHAKASVQKHFSSGFFRIENLWVFPERSSSVVEPLR